MSVLGKYNLVRRPLQYFSDILFFYETITAFYFRILACLLVLGSKTTFMRSRKLFVPISHLDVGFYFRIYDVTLFQLNYKKLFNNFDEVPIYV